MKYFRLSKKYNSFHTPYRLDLVVHKISVAHRGQNSKLDKPQALDYASPTAPHWVVGFDLLKSHGVSRISAVFLCAKSQFTVMLDWVGSRKAGRVVCPVDQPTQSDTMFDLMLSGLKPFTHGVNHD